MARMIPKPIPAPVMADPKKAAERKVYNAFDDQVPEEVLIFFSRSWLGRPALGKPPVEGEADEKNSLVKMAKELDLKNVTFVDQVPKSDGLLLKRFLADR